MCVIALALDASPRWRLVIAANRDEMHARATAPLGWWPDAPHVCAGRDAVAGGTWMGVTRDGRFAAVTNLRDANELPPAGARSRGELVAGFLLPARAVTGCVDAGSAGWADPATRAESPDLAGGNAAARYAERVAARRGRYAGFNLLVGDLALRGAWHWIGSRAQRPQPLGAGVHALSNGSLGDDWFKTRTLAAALRAVLDAPDAGDDEALFAALASRRCPPDEALPDTGVGLARERLLAPVFVQAPGYGTRASTVLRVGRDGRVRLTERSHGADPAAGFVQRTVEFTLG